MGRCPIRKKHVEVQKLKNTCLKKWISRVLTSRMDFTKTREKIFSWMANNAFRKKPKNLRNLILVKIYRKISDNKKLQ